MNQETLNRGNELSSKIRTFQNQILLISAHKEKPLHFNCMDADAEDELIKINEKVNALHLDLLNSALRKAEREFKAL